MNLLFWNKSYFWIYYKCDCWYVVLVSTRRWHPTYVNIEIRIKNSCTITSFEFVAVSFSHVSTTCRKPLQFDFCEFAPQINWKFSPLRNFTCSISFLTDYVKQFILFWIGMRFQPRLKRLSFFKNQVKIFGKILPADFRPTCVYKLTTDNNLFNFGMKSRKLAP